MVHHLLFHSHIVHVCMLSEILALDFNKSQHIFYTFLFKYIFIKLVLCCIFLLFNAGVSAEFRFPILSRWMHVENGGWMINRLGLPSLGLSQPKRLLMIVRPRAFKTNVYNFIATNNISKQAFLSLVSKSKFRLTIRCFLY